LSQKLGFARVGYLAERRIGGLSVFTEMTWFIKAPPWSTSGLVQTAIAGKAHQ
jgi:hypothetical protein